MTLRWARRSLILRLVGLSLLLLLIVQAAGFAVVRATIDRNARAQIARALDLDENVWRRLLEQNADKLRQGSALLAADFGFRSAVNSGDQETIQSVLENHGSRIGAAVTALLDTDLALRAVSLRDDSMDQFPATLRQVVPPLAAQPLGSQVAVMDGVPYQFVMVPMRAPVVIGWVLMGFPINQALADEMRQLLSVNVALVVTGNDGALQIPVSTLPPETLAVLKNQAVMPGELRTPEGTLLVRSSRLDSASASGQVQALLLRSVDEVVAPYRQLQVLLAIITVAGVLLFAAGTGLMAQRLTTPLRSLLAATQRLSRGEYDVPLEHTGRNDEIGNLARSFDHMRVDIGNQQTEIRRLAYWDRLTGLPNRERFRDAVVQAVAGSTATGQALAVLTLDLDRFKHVNDVLGYAFGDRLLQAVAERLTQQMASPDDMVARLGGNEFALLLQGADAAAAHALAQRINQSFEQPIAFEDQTVDLSAAIGFACWPGDAPDADTLLSRSEIAMYAAKRKLSGALQYDASLDSASAQTLSLLTELRRAVEHHELRLFLQPKVSLHGQAGMAAEALLRWQHPQRGLVPPMQFIPFAEQTGFVRHLTLWIFEEVARLLADPRTQGMPLRVSVNLSTRDLLDPELSNRLAAILLRHGVPATAFCLEITESAIMDDPQRAEAMLNRLSEQGFKLSIDDFGTGYSSLAYLKRLPVDELKIDKSFVMGMETGEDDAMIVRSTIDLAHNLGLTVVAEGVETAAILERLRELACDEAQGYHMARPLPVDDFLAWQARQG